MTVGLCLVEMHLAGCHSLKEKRRILRHLKDRLRAKFNLAVAELEYQDLWQRASLGAVSIASSRQPVESCFEQIRAILEAELPGEISSFHVEFLS
jgi:uncharacterized protein